MRKRAEEPSSEKAIFNVRLIAKRMKKRKRLIEITGKSSRALLTRIIPKAVKMSGIKYQSEALIARTMRIRTKRAARHPELSLLS